MNGTAEPRGGRDPSSPVSRALHLLDVIADFGKPARFGDVQAATDLPKATLHRLLRQLEAESMLIYDEPSKRYRLGLRLLRLAHSAWEGASIGAIARPVLDRLAAGLDFTIHLACLEDARVLYLDKRVSRRTVRMFAAPGWIGPAYCTGVGKAMLAHLAPAERADAVAAQAFQRFTDHTITTPAALERDLAAVRARGYAIDDEEHEPTIICVAAPILSGAGAVLGALSLTSTTHVNDIAALAEHVPALKQAAAEIARIAEFQFIDR